MSTTTEPWNPTDDELASLEQQQAPRGPETRGQRNARYDADSAKKHDEQVAKAIERFRPQTAAELDDWYNTTPPPQWLIKRLVPEDAYGVMGAETKAMKTWAASALAVAVATGKPWLGEHEIGKTGSTLMFWGEGGKRSAVRRLRGVATHYGTEFRDLPIHIVTEVPTLLSDIHMVAIGQHIEQVRPTLVIVDPAFLALIGVKLSSAELVYDALNRLRELTDKVGAVLIFVHHWNKTGTGTGHDRFSGAGLAAWGRFLFSVSAKSAEPDHPNQSAKVLRWESVGGEAAEIEWATLMRVHATDPDDLQSPLVYSDAPADLTAIEAPTEGTLTSAARCTEALRGLAKWVTASDVQEYTARNLPAADAHPLKKDTVRKTLARLATDGKVQEVKGGEGAPNLYAHVSVEATAPEVEIDEPF